MGGRGRARGRGQGRGASSPTLVYTGEPGVPGAVEIVPNAVAVPFRPAPQDFISNANLLKSVEKYEYTEIKRLLQKNKIPPFLPCQYNAGHWVMPEVLEVHERILCPDRFDKALRDYEIPGALERIKEDVLSRVELNNKLWSLQVLLENVDGDAVQGVESNTDQELETDEQKGDKGADVEQPEVEVQQEEGKEEPEVKVEEQDEKVDRGEDEKPKEAKPEEVKEVESPNRDEQEPVEEPVKKVPCFAIHGLVNSQGRTCFANAIVQVFVHTPHFRDYFLREPKVLCVKSHKPGKPCIITQVFELVKGYHNSSMGTAVINRLLSHFWKNMPHLGGNQQQDAHEFLTGLVEAIHVHFYPTGDNGSRTNSVTDQALWGQLQSSVTCRDCHVKRIRLERFWHASLEIRNSTRGITLQGILRSYTQLERMGPDCLTDCFQCQRKTETTKQLQFRHLPPILCFQLKRFQQLDGSGSKIDTRVQFPEKLNMAPYLSQEAKFDRDSDLSAEYYLYAVVCHVGSSNHHGHYYCFLNNNYAWFNCNDTWVSQVSTDEVLKSQAYLLFYTSSPPVDRSQLVPYEPEGRCDKNDGVDEVKEGKEPDWNYVARQLQPKIPEPQYVMIPPNADKRERNRINRKNSQTYNENQARKERERQRLLELEKKKWRDSRRFVK